MKQALKLGVPITLLTTLIGSLVGWLFVFWNDYSPIFWGALVGFVIGALGGVFRFGIYACLQHYVLRYSLSKALNFPYFFRDKDTIKFLNDMVSKIFMRKVGGGWIFIHRYLLEHLAAR